MSRLEGPPSRANRIIETSLSHPVATTAGFAIAGGLIIANHRSAEKLWRKGGASEIHELPYKGLDTATAGIVFPGMGCCDGENIANLMNTAAPVDHPWAYFMYDNQGITVKSLAEKYKKFHEERGIKRAVIYASSMGAATALEVAREAGIPIGILIMDSSPSRHKDGYGSVIGRAANKIPYNGGLVGRSLATYTADTIQRGARHPIKNAKHSIDQTLHGATPYLIRSQAHILERFNFERDAYKYSKVIDSNTRAVHVSPPQGEDKTIRVDNAYGSYERGFETLGLRSNLARVIVPDSHHAHAEKGIAELEDFLKYAYEETDHLVYS